MGRDWYVADMPGPHEAVEYGDRCWSRVLMGWTEWRDSGRTTHRNWWPDAYREYCVRNGVEPDPRALAYGTSYESVRADLRDLAAPG